MPKIVEALGHTSKPLLPLRGRWIAITLLLLLSACLARFDPVTYRRLTDLKPVAVRSLQTFAEEELDYTEAENVTLQLEQLHEYERGKGYNEAVSKQVETIRKMYLRSIDSRRKRGRAWSQKQVENKQDLIGAAFDIAIETEAVKNR